ncbi:hypothetical protein CTI12_AA514150 [Artemisia annua]|uniref:Uncharacterized protein n=1 Tax=Artemisia annua TaxID=35608 RepID=A0A2U1L9Z2_ARTAN|nr:hypothetical protein CTI12_AA514150 [Artemisia annua]
MTESSNAALANNVEKRKDKKGEVAEVVAWYFEEKAKALLKKRTEWEANEKRCMKEGQKTTALRQVDHEDILETLDYDTLHMAYDP